MGVISLVGIVAGIVIFIFLSGKGVNMLFGSAVAAIIIALTSALNPLTIFTDTYMSAFANFIKSYYLLFMLAALYGKVMEDSGSIRKISQVLAGGIKHSKHPKFMAVLLLAVFYFILCYVGVSGYVVVFTVLAIFRDLFQECDVPWIMYPYGSAGTSLSVVVGGSLYTSNLIQSQTFGTSLYSGMTLSLICGAVYFIVMCLCIAWDLKKFDKRGEGFLPTGSAISAVNVKQVPNDELPNAVIAFIPLFIPIVAIVALDAHVLVALLAAVVACFVLNVKKFNTFNKLKATIGPGVVGAANPIINVCGVTGLVAIIKLTAGYALLEGMLNSLPSLISGITLGAIVSITVASTFNWITVIGPTVMEKFTEAGLSVDIGSRLICMTGFTYMMPHNAGVVNAIFLAKYDFVQAAWMYWKGTAIPMFCSLITAVVLISMGVFV